MKIRLTLLVLVIGISVLLTSIASMVATWMAVDDEMNELLYEDIHQQSRLLSHFLQHSQLDPQALEVFLQQSFGDDDEDTFLIAVEHLRERWYVSNFALPQIFGSSTSGTIAREFQGYQWQGYQLREGDLLIQLLRRNDLAEDIKTDVAEDILLPTLIGNGISLLLLTLLLVLITRPLSRLSALLRQRQSQDLQPVLLASPIQEIQAVTDSLNQLIRGVADTLQREKRFANDVAHELRTPLTTLNLELSLPDPDPHNLRQEVQRLIRVVEQLLTLARLESSRWQQNFTRFNLSQPLQQTIQRLQPRFAQAGLTLEAQLPDMQVTGDPTLLGLLVENLLLNALRHSQTATRVELSLSQHDQQGVLTVRDNGQGIPAPQRQRLTEPFARLDQRSQGLGLGLAICQQIVQVHQGNMTLGDANPGLEVQVTLPLMQA